MANKIGEAPPYKRPLPKRPLSYAEGVDESPSILNIEEIDVEENTPADQRSSVESVPSDKERVPPLFED
jgi:hypothetical protein